jgi:hypothetical protein
MEDKRGDEAEIGQAKELLLEESPVTEGEEDIVALAVESGDLAKLDELLKRDKTAVDRPDGQGQTLLCRASGYGNLEIVRYLLEKGASPDRGNSVSGHRPLHFASYKGYTSIVSLLLEHKANAGVLGIDQVCPCACVHVCMRLNASPPISSPCARLTLSSLHPITLTPLHPMSAYTAYAGQCLWPRRDR